jgi:GGDEF domain-containing protein
MLDLDRFKAVNDRFGHAMGDALLRGLSEDLHARCHETDVLARLSGDEFALLMPAATGRVALKSGCPAATSDLGGQLAGPLCSKPGEVNSGVDVELCEDVAQMGVHRVR